MPFEKRKDKKDCHSKYGFSTFLTVKSLLHAKEKREECMMKVCYTDNATEMIYMRFVLYMLRACER